MTPSITPLFVGGMPGTPEMMVILMIAILLFGANKIPKLARSTGQAIGEFQRGRQELEEELEEMKEPPSGEAGSSPGAGATPSTESTPSTEAETESTESASTSDATESSDRSER